MPSKSKRNRRNIPRNKNKRVTTSPAASTASPIMPTDTQSEKNTASYSNVSKVSSVAAPSSPYFFNEIRWIGVVTAIIIILLIVSVYVFR